MTPRDLLLSFNWDTDPGGLSFLGVRAYSPATRAIAMFAYLAYRNNRNQRISYSRRKCFYVNRDWCPSYRDVVGAVDWLDDNGLIEHWKVEPGSQNRMQSTFRASSDLVAAMSGAAPVARAPADVIILRDGNKNPLPYRKTRSIDRMRRNLARINEVLASVELWHPDFGVIHPGDPTRIGDANPGPASLTLFRVFTHDFSQHGRFYGGFWQNWPKAERQKLRINGAPVVEGDYPSLHPRLLYADVGADLTGKPYEIPGLRRDVAKVALLVLLNAGDARTATRALQERDWGDIQGGAPDLHEIRQTINALKMRHAPIRHLFHSGIGMALMRRDSEMAEMVMLELLEDGIVALPIHDSFIVRAEFAAHLQEAMDRAFEQANQPPCRRFGPQTAKEPNTARQKGKREGKDGKLETISGTALVVEPKWLSGL